VGALCVLTARDGDAESAMLASWVSQASFQPPGLTIAVSITVCDFHELNFDISAFGLVPNMVDTRLFCSTLHQFFEYCVTTFETF
jgi:hypothetical protein